MGKIIALRGTAIRLAPGPYRLGNGVGGPALGFPPTPWRADIGRRRRALEQALFKLQDTGTGLGTTRFKLGQACTGLGQPML